MKGNLKDREFDKFRESLSGETSISVINETEWDQIQGSFPDPITELYTYSKNSATIFTVIVTYTDSKKTTVLSVMKERV